MRPQAGRLPGRLLVISDRRLAGVALPALAVALAAAGCPWFMIREKDLDRAALISLVRAVKEALGDRPMALSVNGAPEVVRETGVTGLHLAARCDAAEARAELGAGALIGQSVHDAEELRRAIAGGVDYVLASPVFSPLSKGDARATLGQEGLAALAGDSPVPVVALAGINAGNAARCLTAGAAGVAVLGSVMAADAPAEACRALLDALA